MRKFIIAATAALTGLAGASALAAGGETKELKHPHLHSDGIFGTFDPAQLQRGYQVYREVCASCHSMELVAFRHLAEVGAPYNPDVCRNNPDLPSNINCNNPIENPIIKSLAASFQIEDGPDDAGDMFMRAGLPADYFPSPYANKQQAQAANGGSYPPDLSLIAKARHHGPAYVYSLLQGYEDPPETIEIPGGQYYNVYFPGDTTSLFREEFLDEEGHPLEGVKVPYGGTLKMAPPLSDGIVTYEDGTPETVRQYAEDVAAFLTWAAEPKMDQRKAMGRMVLIYLVIFAGIVYASYRQIWRNVH